MGRIRTKEVDVMLGEPRKAIMGMVVPVFIALLLGQINTMVDSVWCSSLGVDALSSISLVSSLYFLIVGVGNGIGIGVNVAVSRRIGAGDKEGAERCSSQSLFLMLLVSFPLIPVMLLAMGPLVFLMGGGDISDECEEYLTPMFLLCTFPILNGVLSGALRGEGAARLSTVINVTGALTNIVLDPLLIFGLDMGLAGASTATMLSSVVAVFLGLSAYLFKWTYLGIRFSRPERSIIGDVFYVGVPQMVELNVMSVMNLILVSLVVMCGGTDGLAVYGTPYRLIGLAMVPANAIAAAMVPVCSSAIGQRDRERLRIGYRFTVKATVLAGLVLGTSIFVLADLLMNMFTYSGNMSQYHDEMVHAVRIYVIAMPLYGFIFVGSSMLSALRRSQYSLVSAFLRNLMLVCFYYISTSHSMDWIYWSFTIGEIIGGLFMLGLAQWQFRIRYRSMPPSVPVSSHP